MSENKRARLFEHPLAFGSFSSWLRLLWDNRDIDRKYVPRVLSVTLSTFITSPFRVLESVWYGRALKNTVIDNHPVFIIGHWRTGTTHLHNLLCQDTNNGYVSTFQAFAPGMCLVGEKAIKRPLNKIATSLHPTREIDNIPLSLDNPEEEDLAIANMSPYSYLHMYTFPRRARHYFEKYITNFDDLPESVHAEWEKFYLSILKKATLDNGGKRLIIKNCADSARLKTLLRLFPDARFIHICRNPYDVFRSTCFMYGVVLARSQIQEINRDEVEAWVLQFYGQLMKRFFSDRALIPDGNIVDVKYEDLEKEPLRELRRIYETLGLPGYGDAEPAFQAYLASITGYKKNVLRNVDDDVITKVNSNWHFVFDKLGYELLQPAGAVKAG